MKQRGRKSSLTVVQDSELSTTNRPEPLRDLTPEQRIEWVTVTNSLPADWFPGETHRVLAQYCRCVSAANHIAQMIQALERGKEIDVSEYDKLLKMQERESRMMASLATKMRITQQATYHPEKKKGGVVVDNPWED